MNSDPLSIQRNAAISRSGVNRSIQPVDLGRSLSFKGSLQQSVVISSLSPQALPWSVGIWFWLGLPAANQCLISYRSNTAGAKGGFDLFEYSTTSTLGLFGYDGTGAIVVNLHPATTFSFNSWNHVAATFGPADNRLYLNGSLAASDTSHSLTVPGGQAMTLGRTSYAATNGLTGLLKQFVYAPVIWSAAEVMALAGSGSVPASATCELRFNELAGSLCLDARGSNSGIYSGDPSHYGRPSLVPPSQSPAGRSPVT